MIHRRLCFGLALLAVLALPGCLITTGPDPEEVTRLDRPPLLRLGDVNEQLTGSWTAYLRGDTGGFKSSLVQALRKEGASLFSSDPAALRIDVEVTIDHEADEPRLMGLGLLSMVTLGLLPLHYASEWDVQGEVVVRTEDGREAARVPVVETGTYDIYVGPPTMFWLLGAGIRGAGDAQKMMDKVSHSIARQLVAAVRQDYDRLAETKDANVPSLEALGGSAEAYLERGRAYLAKGRTDAARADALLYAQNHPRVLAVFDSSSALEIYDEQRRRSVTEQAFARAGASESQGRLREAFDDYARAYAYAPAGDERIRRSEEALLRLYPRLAAKPELSETARRFIVEGEDRVKREDYAGASEAFGKVNGVSPWYAQAYYNRALVLERLERYGEAALAMQRFLELAPDSRHARAARDRMYVWQARSAGP